MKKAEISIYVITEAVARKSGYASELKLVNPPGRMSQKQESDLPTSLCV